MQLQIVMPPLTSELLMGQPKLAEACFLLFSSLAVGACPVFCQCMEMVFHGLILPLMGRPCLALAADASCVALLGFVQTCISLPTAVGGAAADAVSL